MLKGIGLVLYPLVAISILFQGVSFSRRWSIGSIIGVAVFFVLMVVLSEPPAHDAVNATHISHAFVAYIAGMLATGLVIWFSPRT